MEKEMKKEMEKKMKKENLRKDAIEILDGWIRDGYDTICYTNGVVYPIGDVGVDDRHYSLNNFRSIYVDYETCICWVINCLEMGYTL